MSSDETGKKNLLGKFLYDIFITHCLYARKVVFPLKMFVIDEQLNFLCSFGGLLMENMINTNFG